MLLAALLAPVGLIPAHSTLLLAARWRLAYAAGFIVAAFGLHRTHTAVSQARVQIAA
jgi:hypothetical protein